MHILTNVGTVLRKARVQHLRCASQVLTDSWDMAALTWICTCKTQFGSHIHCPQLSRLRCNSTNIQQHIHMGVESCTRMLTSPHQRWGRAHNFNSIGALACAFMACTSAACSFTAALSSSTSSAFP